MPVSETEVEEEYAEAVRSEGLSPYQKEMYLDVIKSVLTPENWKKFKEKYYTNSEMIKETVATYHILGRSKEKINKWFEAFEESEISKLIDKDIDLHEKAIEHLKRLKIGLTRKLVELGEVI